MVFGGFGVAVWRGIGVCAGLLGELTGPAPIRDLLHAEARQRINQSEIEIGIFARHCLGQRRIPDLQTLRRQCMRRQCKTWVLRINEAGNRLTGSLTATPHGRWSALSREWNAFQRAVTALASDPLPATAVTRWRQICKARRALVCPEYGDEVVVRDC